MLTVRKILVASLAVGLFVSVGSAAHAALVRADYNDLSSGLVNGQGGGTGFTGNWDGTSTIYVVSGDLSSSLYNRPQSGTPQSVQGNYGDGRQNSRALASSMSGGIWFSFLVNLPNDNSRGGVSFNQSGYGYGTPRVLAAGTSLYVGLPGSELYVLGQFTVNQTALVVGQMDIGPGNDALNIWVDPDLMANSDIFNYPTAFSSSSTNFADTLSRIGVGSYYYGSGGTTGGTVDNVIFSKSFFDVTGIPEPSTFLIWALGLVGLAWYARRRR